MRTGLEDGRKRFAAMAAFYAERARGGVGLIVTGGFAPNIEGWAKPCMPSAARSRCKSCIPVRCVPAIRDGAVTHPKPDLAVHAA
jgi:2,4-dienoyl-CoA reductase-like NADH-dependent reductase (Old Yellow Enzyme family)